MKFGAVPLEDAAGSILAHSQKLGDRRLKKGTILTQQDIDALRFAGITEITVASPGAGDILEDEAAGLVSCALLPDPARQGIWCSAPFTGRANVYAETSGILRVNSELVRQINGIDESVTLATLPDFTRVTRRQMIGTVKIIPYGAPMHAIASAESVLKGKTALHVEGLRLSTAQLILTQTPGMKDSVVKKGATAVQSRLAALGVELVSEIVVPHTSDALSSALTDHSAEMVLILTGSATSDRGDVG
ncbi:MAG: molybdopterin biosynthesis protein, partial [Pseudomonadota bacterium]